MTEKTDRIRLKLIYDYSWEEWKVLIYEYKGGAFRLYEPATYYTDDKQDAMDTMNVIADNYRKKGLEVQFA